LNLLPTVDLMLLYLHLLLYLHQCKKCQGMAIDLKHNRCLFKDKQMVRLQENPEDIPQVLTRPQVRVVHMPHRTHIACPSLTMSRVHAPLASAPFPIADLAAAVSQEILLLLTVWCGRRERRQ
jgi:hypothetical protein